jgi:hypothetical protein
MLDIDRLATRAPGSSEQTTLVVGMGGAPRNAAIALVADGDILIASEQERFTRTRGSRFSISRTANVLERMPMAKCASGSRSKNCTSNRQLAITARRWARPHMCGIKCSGSRGGSS